LAGPKEGWGGGECGSWSISIDGVLVNSCLVPLLQAKDAQILTIEGARRRPFAQAAASILGLRRSAMRHLHAWNDPRGITPVGQEACADDGRNPRRTLGQSVPLHRVHADFRSGGRCGASPDNKMRSDPQDYQLIAPGTLHAVVSLLAKEPGAWLPIAGGTDVMVLYAAGKLPARKLVNIWNLPELRRIEVFSDEIRIGAGCTYTELREQEIVGREFPLLARAAAWTGGIANQNRGTIGGNIVNASPAADSLPALLVYEAELILVSIRGERRVPYLGFHTGYKTTKLAADELV